ncbi:MAG: hypothetical protein GY941_01655 [Planctomycetes bacterium]|nr:hypothetical protein [Planctomycetota bacterium]
MIDYKNVKVKVFGSSKESKSYDVQDEQKIANTIYEKVLPSTGIAYHSVKVKVKRKAQQKPDHLIAYMLRKDTYTADVVKVDIDENYKVKNVIENYDDSGEEDEENEEDAAFYKEGMEYGVDFIAATPELGIPTAVDAVNRLHDMATNAGLNSKKLLGSAANMANYKNYLKSDLKGFVNIGHGYTGGIVLDDGTLTANWFNSLTAQPVKPAVVYFNSCQVFNPPLQPAVMQSGARTYIGGIVNLGIGPSEEVCKCFWARSLKLLKNMGANLQQCEKEKYPTQGAHGISGDTALFWEKKWHNNLSIIRTHAKHHSQMAWTIFNGSGWLSLKPSSADGLTNVFMILCEALANNRKVDVYIRDGQIEQATLC